MSDKETIISDKPFRPRHTPKIHAAQLELIKLHEEYIAKRTELEDKIWQAVGEELVTLAS